MDLYGDDFVLASTVPLPSKEDFVRRQKLWGNKIEVEDLTYSNDITDLSFLGYQNTNCAYGVKFKRWEKAMIGYFHNTDLTPDDKWLRLIGLKMTMAGCVEGLEICKKIELALTPLVSTTVPKITDLALVQFWTGTESGTSDLDVYFNNDDKESVTLTGIPCGSTETRQELKKATADCSSSSLDKCRGQVDSKHGSGGVVLRSSRPSIKAPEPRWVVTFTEGESIKTDIISRSLITQRKNFLARVKTFYSSKGRTVTNISQHLEQGVKKSSNASKRKWKETTGKEVNKEESKTSTN
jgi:hypothetical protein